MPLTEEQIKSIKQQLLKQIESWPEQQRENAKRQIEAMNAEQLEDFLRKNGMIKDKAEEAEESVGEESGQQAQGKQECVFCLILQGKVPSYKLDENKKSLAILDINPLSPGHSLVISKEHNKLPNQAFVLANKLAKRIKSKLKPEDVKIENATVLGHQLINVIPLYKDIKLEKKKAEEKQLILLQDKLQAKPKQKLEKKPKPEQSKVLPHAPRRTP
jgi:diadenosine tetraphosphate (Ap4A) HIT family hydrolase